MTDFFAGQMDYIYFFYGLAFIVLAAVCYVMMRQKSPVLPWIWLGLFGLMHGLHEWLNFFVLISGDGAPLPQLRVFFLVISYLFLAEFGRAGIAGLRGKGPGRRIYVPLIVVVFLGGLGGIAALDVTARYVLGLVGGLWAAGALYLAGQKTGRGSGRCLTLASAALGFYAAATVIGVSASFPPASWLNREVFFHFFRFPVVLLRGVLAIVAASSLWSFSRMLAREAGISPPPRFVFRPIAAMMFVVAAGWGLTEFTGNVARDQMLKEANLYANSLSVQLVRMLEGVEHEALQKASSPEVIKALQSESPEDLRKLYPIMSTGRHSRFVDSDLPFCYLVDKTGRTVASFNRSRALLNRNESPFIRGMYRHKGGQGGDSISGSRGYYFLDDDQLGQSYYAVTPVKDEGKRLIGFIVLREPLVDFKSAIAKHPFCFLIDPHGVVFLSSRSDMLLTSLWPLKEQARRDLAASGRFGAGPFTALLPAEVKDGQYASVTGKRVLVTRRHLGKDDWSLVLMTPIREIKIYRLFAIFATFVFSGLIIGFFGALHFSHESSAQIAMSERRHRTLVEGSPNCVILFDGEGRCVTINRSGLELLGCSEKDVIGRRLGEMWSCGAGRAPDEIIGEVLEGKRAVFDAESRRPDGRRVEWTAVLNPIPDPEGGIRSFVGIFVDITERKEAEEQLKSFSQRIETIINSSSDIILMKDKDLRFLVVNEQCAKYFGAPIIDIVGKTDFDFMSAEAAEECRRSDEAALQAGVPLETEERAGDRWLNVFKQRVLDKGGNVTGLVAVIRDVTDRKRAEEELKKYHEHLEEMVMERTSELSLTNDRLNSVNEALRDSEARFRSLFDLASDSIFLMDPSAANGPVIVDANVASCIVNGYSREEMIGRPITFLDDPESVRNMPEIMEHIMSGKAATFEVSHVRKDGYVFPVEVSAQLIHLSGKPYIIAIDRDITGRKMADARIRESEQKYKNLVELTTDIIYMSDRNGNHIYMNDAAFEILGYDREEVIGKPFIDLIHPDDREKTRRKRQEMIEKGIDVFSFENRYVTKSGMPIDVLHNVKMIRDEEGRIAGAQGIARDITARKKAEESLLLFSKAVEETMDGIQITDLKGYIVYSNRAIEEIYGFSEEELMGRHASEMNVDPGLAGEVIIPSLNQHGRWNGELLVKHKSGRQFPIWLTTSVIKDSGGHPLALVGVVRDITERRKAEKELDRHREHLVELVEERTVELRTAVQLLTNEINVRKAAEETLKESEERFRKLSREFHTLLDAMPDTLILLSPELEVMWANSSAVSDIGKTTEEVTGRHCYTLLYGRSEPCDDCYALRSFASGYAEHSQLLTPSGRMFEAKAYPIKDEEGRVSNVIVVLSDITEKTALQAEAMRASHLASLGELSAGVAHEINNPINGIINYAQILANKLTTGTKENDIALRVIKEGDRIAGIVRSLLSFARERKEEKVPVTVRKIMNDTITLTETQIRKDGICLMIDVPDTLPEVLANPQQIEQVFLNIISNARYALNRKYQGTHEDKELEIVGELTSIEDVPHVRVTFRDSGIGIPADAMDKVMNPFFSTKPGGHGTGLGLSISHGIIRNHGGRLSLESVEGEYTIVRIDLPARRNDGA